MCCRRLFPKCSLLCPSQTLFLTATIILMVRIFVTIFTLESEASVVMTLYHDMVTTTLNIVGKICIIHVCTLLAERKHLKSMTTAVN